MSRSGAISAVLIAGGVLVAGSVAAIAVVNASSHATDPDTVAIVVDPAAVVAPTPAIPSLESSTLPTVIVPDTSLPTSSVPNPPAKPRATGQPQTSKSPKGDDDHEEGSDDDHEESGEHHDEHHDEHDADDD